MYVKGEFYMCYVEQLLRLSWLYSLENFVKFLHIKTQIKDIKLSMGYIFLANKHVDGYILILDLENFYVQQCVE